MAQLKDTSVTGDLTITNDGTTINVKDEIDALNSNKMKKIENGLIRAHFNSGGDCNTGIESASVKILSVYIINNYGDISLNEVEGIYKLHTDSGKSLQYDIGYYYYTID